MKLLEHDVFAYPTEGVWGLGGLATSKKAFETICALKRRSTQQPVLCVTSSSDHIDQWTHLASLSQEQRLFYEEHKNKFVTFLLPAKETAPIHCVADGKIAFRLTDHAVVRSLVEYFKAPILSTSANLHQHAICQTAKEIQQTFPGLPIIPGQLGQEKAASKIFDLVAFQWVRT